MSYWFLWFTQENSLYYGRNNLFSALNFSNINPDFRLRLKFYSQTKKISVQIFFLNSKQDVASHHNHFLCWYISWTYMMFYCSFVYLGIFRTGGLCDAETFACSYFIMLLFLSMHIYIWINSSIFLVAYYVGQQHVSS